MQVWEPSPLAKVPGPLRQGRGAEWGRVLSREAADGH